MINTEPDNKEEMQELEFDEAMEGEECEEAECLAHRREKTVEISSDGEREEEGQEGVQHREHMHSE